MCLIQKTKVLKKSNMNSNLFIKKINKLTWTKTNFGIVLSWNSLWNNPTLKNTAFTAYWNILGPTKKVETFYLINIKW